MASGNKECLNSTGYEFVRINSPKIIAEEIKKECDNKNIFGTVYVSVEGININLAGREDIVNAVEKFFYKHDLFSNTLFKHTYSEKPPFRKLKIKINSGAHSTSYPDLNWPRGTSSVTFVTPDIGAFIGLSNYKNENLLSELGWTLLSTNIVSEEVIDKNYFGINYVHILF